MKKQDRLRIIEQIKYELSKGVHTYTMCSCGRNGARSDKCWLCLLERLS